jgi:hypothetical protein
MLNNDGFDMGRFMNIDDGIKKLDEIVDLYKVGFYNEQDPRYFTFFMLRETLEAMKEPSEMDKLVSSGAKDVGKRLSDGMDKAILTACSEQNEKLESEFGYDHLGNVVVHKTKPSKSKQAEQTLEDKISSYLFISVVGDCRIKARRILEIIRSHQSPDMISISRDIAKNWVEHVDMCMGYQKETFLYKELRKALQKSE